MGGGGGGGEGRKEGKKEGGGGKKQERPTSEIKPRASNQAAKTLYTNLHHYPAKFLSLSSVHT